jgi:spore germination protein
MRLGLSLLAATALALTPAAALGQRSNNLVLGYYVPYDATSWYSLQAHADQLSIVAAQWVTIDGCGNISSRDNQTVKAFAHGKGLVLVPSLLTLSGWLNRQLLTDEDTAVHAIEQIVSYTTDEAYDGFDLDLEGVDPADRDALSQFVQRTADALHDRGKFLSLAIPAKDRDVTVGWAGAYDYAALGAAADLLTIMAYEYRGPFSGPGSVAPYDWVSRVTAFAAKQIPPEKVLLGLSFYGYDWNTTSGGARSLGYQRTAALAQHFGADPTLDPIQRSLTFSYTADPADVLAPGPPPAGLAQRITTRMAPPCDVTPPGAPTATPVPVPAPNTPQDHEVWYEDSGSAAARLDLAAVAKLGGVSAWRLGLEDPAVWPLLDEWRQRAQGV